MNHRPIIDAGPGLNFLAINKERLLIGTLGKLSAPETVEREILAKARRDRRFGAAGKSWPKLTPKWVEVLSDDMANVELSAVVQRIAVEPMCVRMNSGKDLGEIMVVAHAVVAAEAGTAVTVVIDDGKGAHLAASETRRLERLRSAGCAVGRIRLVGTLTVLERAAGSEHLPDKSEMRDVYKRLREVDDGLPPIEMTRLLDPVLWG
ncbi:hypothetical protein FZ103_12890 [Streptomonospora sp. PA3]|uniref:hypothetical protein n=1 Tax=Streptomonospora sp. PA3 TaxID=2607326 RepID=UPI0012DF0465|nr:hypothetical protein [Streptomonospora sp. PA3]MUL42062.1 hypothetical protein [Streptomonospora sp. PA3]